MADFLKFVDDKKNEQNNLMNKKMDWETKNKPELKKQIIFHVGEIEDALGRIERGINVTDEVENHLNQIRDIFATIEENELSFNEEE